MEKFLEMIKGTSTETIVRTIVMFVALINGVCVLMGWAPLDVDENTIYCIVSGIAMVASSIWAWWKNNSFTPAAKEADAYMKQMKQGLGVEVIEEV